jgi:hypothetical protein
LLFCVILLLKDFLSFVCGMFLFSWTILIVFIFVGVLLFEFVCILEIIMLMANEQDVVTTCVFILFILIL